MNMEAVLNSYDAKLDSKRRLTIRNAKYEYYHVKHKNNGIIILEPRELIDPLSISENSLNMMDSSIKNFKKGKVGKPINLKKF